MTTNESRADRATRALDKAGDTYPSDREEAAVELMTDVLHMLNLYYGLEPVEALGSAWIVFINERGKEGESNRESMASLRLVGEETRR